MCWRPVPRRGPKDDANQVCATGRLAERDEERCNRHVLAAGFPEGSRQHQQKSTERTGSAAGSCSNEVSEPIRSVTDRETGSRARSLYVSGMLRTQASHPVRTLPIALSGSARDAPSRAAPPEPDATPCARTLHRMGEAIMRGDERAGISFFERGGIGENCPLRRKIKSTRNGLYR